MKFTCVGDCAIQKGLPKFYDGFDEVKDYITQGDARFFNLETTICENCFANQYSGGTWLRTSKNIANDMLCYGFNLTTFANNHCVDFSYDGLEQTLNALDEFGIKHSGIGRNLHEAARPTYLDLPSGRVALISCSTSFSKGAMAGMQSRLLPGRPGINGVNIYDTVVLDKNDAYKMKEIAEKTGINAQNEKSRKSGYLAELNDDEIEFGDIKIKIGDYCGIESTADESDLRRIEKSIEDAKFQADFVLVSIHSHDISGIDNTVVPKFLEDMARRFIDCGADCIIGHGPHEIRPIEIYKNRPIFYSLGDFVLHLENCDIIPEDFYRKFGMTSDNSVYEVFKERTQDFTIGLQREKAMMESVIPYFEIENDKLKFLKLMPVELGYGMKHSSIGWPRKMKDDSLLERLKAMSLQYGVDIDVKDGMGYVKVK